MYSASDYLALWQRLLPRGRIWPRDSQAVLTQVLAALVQTYGRLVARDTNLLTDSFPATAVELLPEWERATGLPDPCVVNPTLAQRQAQVVSRVAGGFTPSVPNVVAWAASQGFAITLSFAKVARCGSFQCGDALNDASWANTWIVGAPAVAERRFTCGVSVCGDPLGSFFDDGLLCELERIAPAHVVVLLNRQAGGAGPAAAASAAPVKPTSLVVTYLATGTATPPAIHAAGPLVVQVAAGNGAAAAGWTVYGAVFNGSNAYGSYANGPVTLGSNGAGTLSMPFQATGDYPQFIVGASDYSVSGYAGPVTIS